MTPGIYPVSGAMYWSQTEPAWMGVFIGLPDGRQYCRYELTWRGTPPEDAAKDIAEFRRRVVPSLGAVWAQPSLWPEKVTGPSIAAVFAYAGVTLRKGNDDRVNGWSRLRSWLRPRAYGDDWSPGLIVHPVCTRLIRTLPSLVAAPGDPDDVQDSPLAFPAHAVRFFLMGQPPPWQPVPAPEPGPDTWGAVLHKFRDRSSRTLVGADLVKR